MKIKRSVWKYEVRRTRALLAGEALPIYADAVTNADTVAAIFRGIVGEQPREHFLAFYLDAAHHVMGYETIAIGGACSVEVEPAQVFRGALIAGAVRLIIAHNHPSGQAKPSEQDVTLTRKLLDVSKLIGIPVLDHVIVTSDGLHSFCEARAL